MWYVDNRRHAALTAIGLAVVALAPRGSISKARVSLAIVPILLWIMMSRWWSVAPQYFGAAFMKTIVDAPVMLLVAAVVPWERLVSRLLVFFYAGLAFTWIWSLTHSAARLFVAANEVTWSWHGSFLHKNIMLMFLMFGLALVQAFERRPRLRAVAQISIVALVVLSHSTTGLATLGVVLVLVLWLRWFQAERISRRSAFLLLTLIVGSVLLAVGLLSIPFLAQAAGKDATFSGRTRIWAASWHAIHQSPLRGYGLGGVFFNAALAPTQQILERIGFDVSSAHNGVFDVLLQLGYVGLIAWLVFAVPLIVRGWSLVKQHHPMGQFVVVGVASQLFISISEPVLLLGMFSMMAIMHSQVLSVMWKPDRATRYADEFVQ
jgi:O-antigen ligase